jgi:hypothetical protein
MAKYNGKNYVVKLVRANKSHTCAASGAPIDKGEYYCHLTVDEGGPLRRGKHGSEYHKDAILRISLFVLATVKFESILDSLEVFQDNDARIKKLEYDNQELRHSLDIAAIVKKQLQEDKADLEKKMALLSADKFTLERHINDLKRKLNSVYGATACSAAHLRNMAKKGTELHDLMEEAMKIYETLPKLNKYGYNYEKNFVRLQEIKRELKDKYNTILHEVKL